MDTGLHRIALGFPSGDLRGDLLRAVETPIQALPVHDADLRFRHVEPTAMLGRVMKLDPVQQLPSLGGTEGLVQAGPVVRIQVVLHQPVRRVGAVRNLQQSWIGSE